MRQNEHIDDALCDGDCVFAEPRARRFILKRILLRFGRTDELEHVKAIVHMGAECLLQLVITGRWICITRHALSDADIVAPLDFFCS